jgi:hypothetical protein
MREGCCCDEMNEVHKGRMQDSKVSHSSSLRNFFHSSALI